jgi:hypothetical protein
LLDSAESPADLEHQAVVRSRSSRHTRRRSRRPSGLAGLWWGVLLRCALRAPTDGGLRVQPEAGVTQGTRGTHSGYKGYPLEGVQGVPTRRSTRGTH